MDQLDARVQEYAKRAGLSSFAVDAASVTRVAQDAAVYAAQPDALHNDPGPSTALQTEKPEHVLMCYMLAAGKSRQEIATTTGYSYTAVCNIVRQPFFRQRYLRIAREAGMEETEAFLKGETMASLETLVEVRNNGQKSSDRIAAANSLLDRALGKAVVKVETKDLGNLDVAASTKEAIERELTNVRKELSIRGIPSGTN